MLLFTEGFDWSITVADFITYGKWLDRTTGGIGNTVGVLRFGSGSGNYWNTLSGTPVNEFIRRPIGQNLASGVIGIAVRNSSAASYNRNLIVLFDTTATVQMGLKVNTDGTLSLFRTSHATILATSTFTMAGNTWYYVELKWKISDSISANDVIVYVDGVDVLNLAAANDTKNTTNAYATHYAFNGNAPAVTTPSTGALQLDDHYLIDFTGSANNAALGPVRIQTLYPDGNGTNNGFIGSDGNSVNNYQQVDDPALAVADYNDGTAAAQKDTYTFTDTGATTSVIKGLTINFVATKTDTDPRGVKPVVRHSGTDYDGTEQLLSASTLNYQQVYETNPGTSSGWTKTDVDAAEFGLKVST